MLLKNRSELLFPLSRQKIPIVFEIQSSEPINYSEIKCQITLHLNFFFENGLEFLQNHSIYETHANPHSENNFLPSQQVQLLFLFSFIGLI